MRNSITRFALMGSLLLPLLSSAQELRLYGGMNGTNVKDAGNEQWIGRSGYQFGADLLIGDRWFLMPGLEFIVQNVNYTYAGTSPDGSITYPSQEYKYTTNSLRVPLMLGLHLFDQASDPAINVYVLGGPSAMMNLKANLNNDALTVETNKTQWYLGFGGGVELGFLFVEAGYDVGMSNVFKGDDFQTNPELNFLHINAGLRLRLVQ